MEHMKKTLAAAVVLGGAATGFAHADREDARAMEAAKITLIEAIQAAETHQGGKAFEAQIEDDSFTPEYEVNILADGKVYDVRVNAETGDVIGSREDLDD
ncbi:hypothetical protein HY29_02415 [Hyphomonas beringensis]|uniref:PepSY domain-containing protein n=1 Tax=Hyphomonas beringensis TaxID=1280946 RepID=A0A062UEQ9_9PROT|nr:PepSY domain-containing protein [Hyphomonas beringensis]KCZ55084.1 hypothetical protein HY29_02415 [Hyphomonas beringensis]